jgi:hypothetical protein
MLEFPAYYSHHAVRCMNCDELLNGHPEGTESGHGKWAQWCERCQMWTYYDIERDPDEWLEDKRDREAEASRFSDYPFD